MIRSWLVLLALWAPMAYACEQPAGYIPIAERSPNAQLYRVTGCGMPERYLFGTYHSDSPKLQPIIEHLTPYLWNTKRLWVEIVSSPEQLAQTQRFLLLPKGSPPLSDIIGPALYAEVKATIAPALGLPETSLQRFHPWALALLVQYPPPESDGIILDVKLQQLAARKAVLISGLETLPDQFSIFTEMPKSMQIDFLKSTLEDFDSIRGTIARLEALYLSGDINAIEQLSREQFGTMAERYPELTAYLERRLIDERNRHMADIINSRINYPAFIAVGALHLPGNTGLFSLLEAEGLQIHPVK